MMEYSAIKRNERLVCAVTWVDLKGIMLSEKKNANLCGSIYITFPKCQNYRAGEQKSVVIKASGWDTVAAQDVFIKSSYSGLLCRVEQLYSLIVLMAT